MYLTLDQCLYIGIFLSRIISNEKAHWCFINVSRRRESQATAFPGNQPLPSYFQIFNMKLHLWKAAAVGEERVCITRNQSEEAKIKSEPHDHLEGQIWGHA